MKGKDDLRDAAEQLLSAAMEAGFNLTVAMGEHQKGCECAACLALRELNAALGRMAVVLPCKGGSEEPSTE